MAAYASVISLKHTIKRLLNSPQISFIPSPQIIESANDDLHSLRKSLLRLDRCSKSRSRNKINALDDQIRDAVCKLEDLLESHLSNQILSQSESGDEIQFTIDLQESELEMLRLLATLKEMEQDYIIELDNPDDDDDDDEEEEEDIVPLRIDSSEIDSKMIGFSDKFLEIKDRIFRVDGLHVVTPITGMAGIGKTTIANEIFNDFDISKHFDLRAWVRVGRKWRLKEILLAILGQLDCDMNGMITGEEVKNVGDYLKERLNGKKHLIVLDDVWDKQIWNELNNLFEDSNGRKVLITTRLDQVGRAASNPVSGIVKMRLLNKEESWDLLREKVFGEEMCSYELEKIGRKIAGNCEGLPLLIVAVADLLCQEERKPEYWNEVAERKNSVFMDAYGAILKVLYPSFEYLAQVLRPFFLYMGVFPRNYEIPKSKVVTMWAAEGFPEPLGWQTANVYSEKCLRALIYNNLVLLHHECTIWNLTSAGVKSCLLHTSMWHLCIREATKNKFFHVLDRYGDHLEDGMESQRRLSIHNNILFSLKDVHNLIEDNCALTARSLLCFGSYCHYQVPICFGLRLLRVLDALTIRFYEFPTEVVKLIQLRSLALTCDGDLPASISKLWNLQFLIVFRHLIIKPFEDVSYLPLEIWDMKELKHLQVVGSNLRNPRGGGASLPNLSTLLDVSARTCTQAVFEAIPNLRKLGIRIESDPDVGEPVSFFDQISNLKRLQILKCVVVNPDLDLMSEVCLPHVPLQTSLSVLKKLHLSGLGYSWDHMSKIGLLPNLEVLKLRCYAFQGPTWLVEEKSFPKLGYLVIEDTDLVEWEVREGGCPNLYSLRIKHCYLLEEIHGRFGRNFGKIEVDDSNPSTVTCLKQMINAEGFVKSNGDNFSLEEEAENYLKALVERNLLLDRDYGYSGKARKCSMHDLLRDVCTRKADEDKFLHIWSDPKIPCSNLRRMSVLPSFPLEVESSESSSIALSRTFLCLRSDSCVIGTENLAFYALRLLRVLDVFDVNFLGFPEEVLQLVNLRYLALTCYALPDGISKLCNLRTLFFKLRFKTVPSELLEMPELRHIIINRAIRMDDDYRKRVALKKLVKIKYVAVDQSVIRRGLFENIPNIKDLGIYFARESVSDDAVDLSRLYKLETLRCNFGQYSRGCLSTVTYPCMLRKLTLSRCVISRGVLSTLCALSKLEVLKLWRCDFESEGETYEVWEAAEEDVFLSLQCLKLEWLHVECWRADETNFPRLRHLLIHYCRWLEEIPSGIGEISALQSIELYGCLDSLEASAKEIQEVQQSELGDYSLQLRISQ